MLNMDLISWRTVAENTIEYSVGIDHCAYFSKLISIWKSQCQSVNRRLASSVLVLNNSDEYNDVMNMVNKDLLRLLSEKLIDVDIRKLIPRTNLFSERCYEVSFEDVATDADKLGHVFYPVQMDPLGSDYRHSHIPYPYRVSITVLSESSMRFNLSVPIDASDTSMYWLINTAYPALKKWLEKLDLTKESTPSNRLLSAERYSLRYRKIKEEKGRGIAEKWTEKTDPHKFVYEDCGIATYILETWERLGKKPKMFADLGCGNGLLVHLLNEEGAPGIGLDVRSRKIWSSLFSNADLRTVTIDPTLSDTGIPDHVDYLIGNHSDELTPWIPIMAAKKKCDFILIPCCPFDFYGKYNLRTGDVGSSYSSFLNFVEDVCRNLGFIVETDRLSIPSTKRICYVCTVPPEGLPHDIDDIISCLTKVKEGQTRSSFVKRCVQEEVRNCSHIDSVTRTHIIKLVFDLLLTSSEERINGWRCGAKLPLGEIIKKISPEHRALMKQQDGGLQTFLKNQYQTFMVIGGIVMIRDWRIIKKSLPNKLPTTPCWMLSNHPDGCPYKSECRFKHS